MEAPTKDAFYEAIAENDIKRAHSLLHSKSLDDEVIKEAAEDYRSIRQKRIQSLKGNDGTISVGNKVEVLDELLHAVAANFLHAIRLRSMETLYLSARIAELEKQPFEYFGVHEGGKSYRKNSVVSHSGSMWVAKEATSQRPGDGPAWQLAVKAGRDAR